ncbi:carbohydrate sulfotransferase 11 isoform X2 [Strongylocentrotus purpuratus]|uniref:Carbohydrate sulfotransferase n=1 Tax=Strongylocentrotus purpuratus TaxID=7668 RepID=A0A7M7LVX2_STRPU|nr:carbohydrate sulfotransferase 11 isoform X2 [Strongylocentrotus purpuratus]|eukprot:XP_011668709.1 PREDICTED: carbohydrate sulfotransferase 11-like [Strongylocentrotus purpuratus]
MLSPYKHKTVLCVTAIIGMVVCSIYTSLSSPSARHLMNIEYESFSKINHTAPLRRMTSTSNSGRPFQEKVKLPLRYTTKSNSTLAPTSLTVNGDKESLDFMDIQADIQRRRRTQLKDGCLARDMHLNQGVNMPGSKLIVDDKYKLVYCNVPKVACTSWKRVFLVLNGVMKHPDDLSQSQVNNHVGPRKLKFLNSYNKSRRAEILESYTKFLVVRHPFHRILSAYQNKLWAGSTSNSSTAFQSKYGLHILKQYRPNTILNNKSGSIERKVISITKAQKVNYDLRFDEFVKFLTNTTEKASFLEQNHWRAINQLCGPCQIDYDVIGHFDSLVDDALYILRLVHADHVVEFPSSKGSSPTNSSSNSLYESYYAEVPRTDLEKLYQKYRLDFELFGYEKPAVIV